MKIEKRLELFMETCREYLKGLYNLKCIVQGDHRNQKTIFQSFWAQKGVFQLFLTKKYIFFQPLVTKNIIYSSLIYKLIHN